MSKTLRQTVDELGNKIDAITDCLRQDITMSKLRINYLETHNGDKETIRLYKERLAAYEISLSRIKEIVAG